MHFAWMLGLLLPTNGFSIKPLKVRLLADEQKATEKARYVFAVFGISPGEFRGDEDEEHSLRLALLLNAAQAALQCRGGLPSARCSPKTIEL